MVIDKISIKQRLEDFLAKNNFDDKTIVLAVASFLGGQAILLNKGKSASFQEIKEDGSTVGILDTTSELTIVNYVTQSNLENVQFRSEEKMPFKIVKNQKYNGIFDGLDAV